MEAQLPFQAACLPGNLAADLSFCLISVSSWLPCCRPAGLPACQPACHDGISFFLISSPRALLPMFSSAELALTAHVRTLTCSYRPDGPPSVLASVSPMLNRPLPKVTGPEHRKPKEGPVCLAAWLPGCLAARRPACLAAWKPACSGTPCEPRPAAQPWGKAVGWRLHGRTSSISRRTCASASWPGSPRPRESIQLHGSTCLSAYLPWLPDSQCALASYLVASPTPTRVRRRPSATSGKARLRRRRAP